MTEIGFSTEIIVWGAFGVVVVGWALISGALAYHWNMYRFESDGAIPVYIYWFGSILLIGISAALFIIALYF